MIYFLRKEIILVLLFKTYVFLYVLSISGVLLSISIINSELFSDFINNILLPIIILFHAGQTIGLKRGFVYIILAAFSGFVFELSGLRYGALFDNPYLYNKTGALLYGVPLEVILYWGIFIYIGYAITNSLFTDTNNNLVNIFKKILTDGVIVTSIDLLLDPIGVAAGNWIWVNGGVYFSVPFGNFVSWFLIVVVVTSVFRLYEYFVPMQRLNTTFEIESIPIKVYTVLFIVYCLYALLLKLYTLLLIGTLPMLTIILFFHYRISKDHFAVKT